MLNSAPSPSDGAPLSSARPAIVFNSEALLREALRALLSKIPGIRLHQSTHGVQEVGKDLIFYLPGGLGEDMLCACVVKNAPLDGKSSPSARGALAILNQVEQALLNPKRMPSGNEVPIQKVFIVTPYDLPDSTINAIWGHLKDRGGRVEFIGGARLFDLFKKHWPEYLADEFSAVQQHLRSTTVRLQEERPLEQIAISYRIGAPDRAVTKYYVQPNFHQDLVAVALSESLQFIVYRSFQKPGGGTTSLSSSESGRRGQPKRIAVSSDDVEKCRNNREALAQILDFLARWEFCTHDVRESILSDYGAYIDRIIKARERRLASDNDRFSEGAVDRSSPFRHLSRTRFVDLSATESRDILAEGGRLSARVNRVLEPLGSELTTAAGLVYERSLYGVAALTDPRYKVAVKINDMYQLAPPGLFSQVVKTLRVPVEETSDHELSSGDQRARGSVSGQQGILRRVSFPNDFLDLFKHSVLLVGAAGYGKTSFCRWNALNDAQRFAQGKSECVPAYFALHEIARGRLDSFEKVFLDQVGLSALIPEGAVTGDKQNLRLYLDGLDEVPRDETRRQIVDLVRDGLGRLRNIQVVITARDYILGPWLSWLPKFHLSEFTTEQIEQLEENWFDRDPVRLEEFGSQLRRSPSLQKVISVPLLATLVILIFKFTGNLPSSRKRLYEIFVDLMNSGWDLAKGVQRGMKYGAVVKLAVLKRLAYSAHSKRLRQFPEALVRQTISASLKTGATAVPWQEVLDEILQDGLLVSSGTALNFAHLSFQEFLAAESLVGDPHGNRRARVLGEFLRGDNWWKEVLSFYIELSSNTKELYEWINEACEPFKEADAEIAAGQGRSLLQHIRTTFPELAL